MELKNIYKLCDFNPTPEQNKVVESIEGPNLVIAGPGSGKSQVLLFRTINLLVNRNIPPENIILCTFTEKAAAQLIERLALLLEKIDIDINIYDLKFGTIHSICSRIIDENIELSLFKNNYGILDEITQYLFIHENFNKLLEPLEFKKK